jgi:GH35 family endo-1,4-beta-xylanase
MMKKLLSLVLIFTGIVAQAQDGYHTYLNQLFQNDYNLPQGEWVFFDSETDIYDATIAYGGSFSLQSASNQEFDNKIRGIISNAGNNPWDSGWKISNQETMQAGDKMLAVFYLRSVNGTGEVNFFIENNTTFNKEVYLQMPLSEEWRLYFVPFESMNTYAPGACGWGFHLATQAQTIEIGGFTAINFDSNVNIEDLPNQVNNQFYGGYEVDAPWRSAAADRIDNLRKADLNIAVQRADGTPIENAAVDVKMLEHEFGFGSAIVASRIANNPAYNVIYENKITNLDGQGHGFNTVVFENDLKWDAWEEEWLVNKEELADAVAWLKEQDIEIRGHTLVWPGTNFLPDDIPQNYSNISYIQDRINDHIEEIMLYPGIGPEIHNWDVLNEIAVNQDVANAFSASDQYETGRELYVEIFEKAREVDPNVGLWLNDYVTMTLSQNAGDVLYDRLKQYTQELVDAGVDIEGIGFQGHIGGSPNSIYEVLATLDDFHQSFGLKAKITEFDLPSFVDEQLAADYLRDFLTAIFSHESVDGFLFWSFWDGQTYMNAGSNLYRQDWSETPAHTAFVDLLFNEWWTEESHLSEANGQIDTRVFKGLYEISYECDGTIVRDTLSITDLMDYTITCDNISTNTKEVEQKEFKVFPNPSNGNLRVESSSSAPTTINVVDVNGKIIRTVDLMESSFQLDLTDLKGIYFLEFRTMNNLQYERILIE